MINYKLVTLVLELSEQIVHEKISILHLKKIIRDNMTLFSETDNEHVFTCLMALDRTKKHHVVCNIMLGMSQQLMINYSKQEGI